jgi:hypothetical protein
MILGQAVHPSRVQRSRTMARLNQQMAELRRRPDHIEALLVGAIGPAAAGGAGLALVALGVSPIFGLAVLLVGTPAFAPAYARLRKKTRGFIDLALAYTMVSVIPEVIVILIIAWYLLDPSGPD